MRNLAKKLTFSVLAAVLLVALALAVLEGFARLAGAGATGAVTADGWSHLYEPDPEMLYWLRAGVDLIDPEGIRWRTNRFGLRGEETSEDKPGATLRVLSIGESSAFGLHVREEEAYPAVLQTLLAKRLRTLRPEVLNAGCPAATSTMGAQFLKKRGLALHPDVVLAYFYINDHQGAAELHNETMQLVARNVAGFGGGATDHELSLRRRQFAWLLPWLETSAFYRLYRSLLLGLTVSNSSPVKPSSPSLSRSRPSHTSREAKHGEERGGEETRVLRAPYEDQLRNYRLMASLAHSHGARMVFVVPAYRTMGTRAGEAKAFGKAMRVVAAEYRTSVVDAGAAVERYVLARQKEVPAFERGRLFVNDAHPNAEGHRVIAEAIFDVLDNEVLPKNL